MIHRFSVPSDPYADITNKYHNFIGNRSDMERDFPLVQVHDSESADLRLAMNIATEVCNISGAMVDVHQRTDNFGNVDDVFDEDPDPTYWPPHVFKAFFAPGAIELALKTWGADAQVKIEMYFSMQELIRRFGSRVLRVGDVVYVPFNAIGNITPKHFRIVNFTPVGNYRYHWLYAKCNCESLTGDLNVVPRDVHGDQRGSQIADY